MAKTLKEMRVATPQTRGMAGSRGIMRKKTGPRGANKKEKVYEPTRGQLNNIRRRGEGISSTTKFMDQVRSIAPSVYNHPKVQDIFRNHAETNEDVEKKILRKASERARKTMSSTLSPDQKRPINKKLQDRFRASKRLSVARKKDALDKATTSYDKHNKNDVLAKHGFKRPTSEAVNPHDDEGANHIVMQLRKAVTLRGMRPVEFKDGKKVRVEVGHAQKFLSKYNQAKPADKEKMQAKAQKSHGHFKSTIGEEFELNEDPSKSLKDKSEKSRIPVSILRSVYNRGMAAW
ncbi:MAG TPA: hypothetical protein DCM40_36950, partial [Maribacter sp.]|nr:hypothetical protein [Maribacter sp.]